MKAQSLSICLPQTNGLCNKNCPYCVSRMTGYGDSNIDLFRENLPVVERIARASQVNSVIITGKGEPTLSSQLFPVLSWLKDFPTELQTNGLRLLEQLDLLLELRRVAKLNVLAISIDQCWQFESFSAIFKSAKELGLVTRATVAVTDLLSNSSLAEFVSLCKSCSVDQLSFRQVTIPHFGIASTAEARATVEWIQKHVRDRDYQELIKEIDSTGEVIRRLSYGAVVKDIDGIAVTYFDYCIQDKHSDDDVRSLIYREDGHLYTSWNSKASIIF